MSYVNTPARARTHAHAHNIPVMLKTGYCAAANEEADTHVESQKSGVRGEG